MRFPRLLLFLLPVFLGLATGAHAQQAADPVAREAYKANLTACISLAKTCDKGRLTKAAQDYVAYEVGTKRFTKQEVAEVVGVRMEWLGREPETVMGQATGHWSSRRRGSDPSPSNGASPTMASSRSFGCTRHVEGYYRSNGTYVNGYDRRC